jgi:hypothetical protein
MADTTPIADYAINNLTRRIESIEDEVAGLHDAHKATVAAMDANTLAMTGLNRTISRIEETVEHKLDKLSDSYQDHVIASEKDKASLSWLAI